MKTHSLPNVGTIDRLILSFIGSSQSSSYLPENIDWDLFLKRVFNEGVGGLVYYHLKDRLLFSLPETVSKALENYYLTNLGRNLCIEEELKSLVQRFQQKKVDILLIRGADFLRWLYPSLGVRPMADIDAVVRSRDFLDAQKILGELGYCFSQGYPYLWYKDDVSIDIHLDVVGFWRVASWPSTISIENKDIWDMTVPYDQETSYARCLGIYDSILGCCSHLQMHSFQRLIWFVDIATLINSKEDFDWHLLLERALRFNLLKPLYFVVKYLDKAQLISLPQGIDSKLRRLKLNWFEKRNLRLLLKNERKGICGELLFLFSVPTLFRKIKFIRDIICIEEEKFVLANQKLTFWIYCLRFFRISFYVAQRALAVLWR